jgi:hypothetical protein
MFSQEGRWLTTDASCPLFGWDLRDIVQSGKRYGCTPEDIFGCFYFHVRGELAELARRLRRFKLDVRVTSADAHALAADLRRDAAPPRFDRVETSNMCDFAGIPAVLEDWAPLLNRANPHAAVLMYSLNWHGFGAADAARLLSSRSRSGPRARAADELRRRAVGFQVREHSHVSGSAVDMRCS